MIRPWAAALGLLALAVPLSASPRMAVERGESLRDSVIGIPDMEEAPQRVLASSSVGTGYTVIPLPAFIYNRNEGVWAGGLLPIFRANAKGEVEDIYAPLYLHNKTIGETFTFEYLGYREHVRQFHALLSKATKVEHVLDFGYQDIHVMDKDYILGIAAISNRSAFNRFFGLGNNTLDSAESAYTMEDNVLKAAGGLKVGEGQSLLVTDRYRNVNIDDSPIADLPQTQDKFPTLPGIIGANIWGQSLTYLYDTRDSQLTPLTGTYASALAEYNRNFNSGDRTSWARFTGDAKHFFPTGYNNVFVAHAMLDAVTGQSVNQRGIPFYERPTLGGENTLRGFGRGRFVGNVAVLFNFEERFAVFSKSIMGNLIELELAPFLDMGRVGKNFNTDRTIKYIQFNPGVGVRLLARPNIAARLDLAQGKDGATVFVGLDYPF